MALYDPSTGQWYSYTPSTGPDYDYTGALVDNGTPSSLSAVTAPAGMSGANLVDPTNQDADSIASSLLNAQYGEWESTFKPIEESLMNQLSFNNPSVLTDAVTKADQASTQASGQMSGILERQNAAMGINPTADQSAVMSRMLNLNTAANTATAENQARANVKSQDMQILMGSIPNYQVASAAMNSTSS